MLTTVTKKKRQVRNAKVSGSSKSFTPTDTDICKSSSYNSGKRSAITIPTNLPVHQEQQAHVHMPHDAAGVPQ